MASLFSAPLLSPFQEIRFAQQARFAFALLNLRDDLRSGLGRLPSQDEWAAAARLSTDDLLRVIALGEKARERLFASNLRWVYRVAKRYSRSNVEMEDLIQEGSIGLLTAIRKFDPTKGRRFSTYAFWWIRNSIQLALCKQSPIRVPIRAIKGLGPDNLRHVVPPVVSLDSPVCRDRKESLLDSLPDHRPSGDLCPYQELREAVQQLNEPFRSVLTLRYALDGGEELSFQAIGQQLFFSGESVRRYHNRGVAMLQAIYRAPDAQCA